MSNVSGGLFYNYNIEQLHSLIKAKEIHSRDIVEECINKTKEIDPKYHIWSFFDEKDTSILFNSDICTRLIV